MKGGLEILIEKNVPVGVGLGSSGASAAACVRALDSLLELDMSEEELVRVARLGEEAATGNPHADNVAASLLGGFTIVYGRNPAKVMSISPPKNLTAVVVTPQVKLPRKKTKLARSLVPRSVKLQDAILNLGRASALATGFARGNIELIGSGMEDSIAEPYREKLIPGYREVKRAALKAEAAGVAISGAGPSVLAIVNSGHHDPLRVANSMVQQFARSGVRSTFFLSKPAPRANLVRSR